MKRIFSLVFAVALLLAVPAGALESSDAAIEAYNNINAAIEAEYGVDEAMGVAYYPDEFAGAWLDEENYLVIGLTDMSQPVQDYYAGLSGNGAVIRFTQAKYSLWDLLEIQTEISNTYRETEQEGFFLEGAMVDVATNTLQLTVVQGGLEKALEYYQAIYGDAISAVEGEALMELPTDGEVEGAIRIKLWVLVVAAIVLVAVVVLVIVLIVKLTRRGRKNKQEKKRQAELAAAKAAQAAKAKKSRKK